MKALKRTTVAVIGVVAIAIAATAVAFWTTTGSGSDDATVGSVGDLTVAVELADGSHPGDGPDGVAVTGTVTNDTTSAISVSGVSGDPAKAATNHLTVDDAHAACDLRDFTLTIDPLAGAPVILAANGGTTPFTGRLVMTESGIDQNACQGAVLTVHLVAA